MPINVSQFFTRAGSIINSAIETRTAGATVETAIEAAAQTLGTLPLEFEQAREGLRSANNAFKDSAAAAISAAVADPLTNLLIQTAIAGADDPLPSEDEGAALDELIRQMIDQAETVDANEPTIAVVADGGNSGDGVIVASVKTANGKPAQFALAEEIRVEITDEDSGESSASVTSGESETNGLSLDWPKGSGVQSTIISGTAEESGNLAPTPTLETVDDYETDLPATWAAPVGVLGTTVKLSDVEQQTVTISSDPAAGYYVLKFTADGKTYATDRLAYNATGEDVQAELIQLPGLALVTVSTTGDTPNFTHTITFTGVPNPAELTSDNNTDVGAIAHATTVAGSAHALRGARVLEFDNTGAELTEVVLPVTLDPLTQYAFAIWMKADVVPASGEIELSLVDAFSGAAIVNDEEGTANSTAIDATTITTGHKVYTAIFRTPANMPEATYIRIKQTTPLPAASSVFVGEVSLQPMTSLYTGGPSVAAFTGATVWAIGDGLSVNVTNDYRGQFQTEFDRIFDLRGNAKELPSATGAAETVDDALIT